MYFTSRSNYRIHSGVLLGHFPVPSLVHVFKRPGVFEGRTRRF